jgi:hypothetical protein
MPNSIENANQITAPFAGWLTMVSSSTLATYLDLQACGPQTYNGVIVVGPVVHVAGTGPACTISGVPTAVVNSVEVDLTNAGGVNTALFNVKVNGSTIATAQTVVTAYTIGSTGLTFNFASSLYVTTDVYSVVVTNTPLLDLLPNELNPTGCVERYTRFEAITSTAGLLFGPTSLSVTGANAPNLTATGVNAQGVCVQVPAGSYVDYLITPSTRYMGFVGSGAGYVNVSPTSKGLK